MSTFTTLIYGNETVIVCSRHDNRHCIIFFNDFIQRNTAIRIGNIDTSNSPSTTGTLVN